jgi:hypothetical protein
MKKKFTLMMILLLIFGSVSFGQATASLAPPITASPGEVVVAPLMVTNFNSVGAITFQIDFTTSMLNFINITPDVQPGNFIAHMSSDSSLIITYTASPPNWLTIINGKLLDINFIYTGPGTTPLNFIPSGCEVVTGGMVPIPVTYTNGSVSQDLTITTKATLVGGTASTGGQIAVQLRYENFLDSAGSITQNVHYDVSKMDFINTVGQGTLAGVIGNASGGVVHLVWTGSTGHDINWTTVKQTNKILLNFVYTGSTTTNLEFYPGCIITTTTPTNIKVSYYNGLVSPGPQVASATLGSITGAQQGQDYEIPLNLSGFDVLGANTAAAITLNIPYDSPRLSFINASSNPHGATVNASGSVISIVWTNPGAPALIDGDFLKLNFKYNGIGVANLNFGAGCLFTTNTGNPIQVGYTNGTITPSANHDAYIGMPIGANGTDIAVPVYFKNMPSDVGAITLYIAFDDSKLTYHPVTDFPPVGSANFSVTGNVIQIVWTSTTPWSDINTNTFCNLNFHINGGGPTPITFEDGCEIANNHTTPDIIPTNWHNGGVNMAYMVSGFLTYNNVSNSPLVGFTVYLQDGPQPIPPAIVPIPANIASTTTDVNGYFEMSVPNGTYYLYASTTTPWAINAVNTSDVINLKRYIAGLSNTIGSNTPPPPPWSLRQLAGNINWDGFINTGDVIPLQRRIALLTPNPNYKAPDWIFQNPVVVVNNANMINQNFMGICSGDVNGSYPNP